MGEQRQRYNRKFKEETVKYVQASRKSLTDIAEELNIPPGTLQKWVGQYTALCFRSRRCAQFLAYHGANFTSG